MALTVVVTHAQTVLVPAENILDKKDLHNGTYQMALFMEIEGKLEEAFSFTLTVNYTGKTLAIYTSMLMVFDSEDAATTDTSISDGNTFKPIYRSSNGQFHKMVINYGKNVSGYYYDKKTQKRYKIKEHGGAFFDNYTYPYLLGLLPLTTGYKSEMAVFDFKPDNSTNLKTAHIDEVKSEVYVSELSGEHKVWKVKVYEEVTNDSFVYYIDQETRRIWKIDFVLHGTHMMFIDKEEDAKVKSSL
ncbi:MAG TPA: hypothetical protein VM187_14475 [Niastella sp.]|nr:hypothetical protein [Niastella sp.]